MAARLPVAQAREVVSFGVAGVGAFAPLYLMLAPGAEEAMSRQTTQWAPRWEHVAQHYISPRVQHTVRHRIAPPVQRTMQHVDRVAGPHMARAALHVDRRIRRGLERWRGV